MTNSLFAKTFEAISLALLIFALCSVARADLISVDLYEEGDGLLTLDTETNLQWLDVTQSDQGVENVGEQLRLGENGAFPGFRWATAEEFLALILTNTKWTLDQNFEVQDRPEVYASLARLFLFLGFASDPSDPSFFAIANTCNSPPDQPNACVLHNFDGNILMYDVYGSGAYGNDHWLSLGNRPSHQYEIWHANFLTPSNYQLLVRSVPEPGTIALFLGGLLMMGFAGRRRRLI